MPVTTFTVAEMIENMVSAELFSSMMMIMMLSFHGTIILKQPDFIVLKQLQHHVEL